MTSGPGPEARVTLRQALVWGLAFAAIVALVILYFLYGRQVVSLLGS